MVGKIGLALFHNCDDSIDSGGVNRDLIYTDVQQGFHIFQTTDTPANGERDGSDGADFPHPLQSCFPILDSSEDVKEDKFIGALFAVRLCCFYGVASILQVNELDAP